MIRVLQNLPHKLSKSYHGGVYWANRGQTVAESQRRKHRDKIVFVSHPNHVLGASLHTTSKLEKVGKQESSDEEWKKSFKQRIEWDSFRRSSYASEALGWGSIIVLGLQIGRFISAGSFGDNRRRDHDGLLASIAQVLPCSYSSRQVLSYRRSILPEEDGQKRNNDTSQSSSDESSLYLTDESPYWDFKISDGESGGFVNSAEKSSPPSSSSSSSFSSYATSSSHTTNDSSIPSSSTFDGIPPPSNAESKVPFDQVTRQCWGRVNNIIGGHLMTEGEEEKAVHHFKIASEAGYSKGQYNLGMCYELGRGVLRDDVKAAVFFGLAAHQGHPQAQYKLGTYHLDGKGDMEQCEQTALTLITQAAAGGVVQAQSYLGMYYMTGEEPDPKKAVAYLQAAAKQKDPEAQYHLGLCYEYGWGVDTNQARASSLYHSAASKDHAPSLYALGLFHEKGLGGLPENPGHAKELFTKASLLGYEKAAQKLTEIESEGSPFQRSGLGSSLALSSDSLTSWATSSESGSESAGSCATLSGSSSGSSSDSEVSVCFDDRAPLRIEWRDLLPHTTGNIHVSVSAPELSRKKTPSMMHGSGDDVQVNSILHSLSCLTFPVLQREVNVKGQEGQSDGRWLLETRRLIDSVSAGDRESDPARLGKVRFQLGGLEEDGDVDWCEPLDTFAQQRLVSFKRATAVV